MSYIFDPATAPEEIRGDLLTVWENTSQSYRDYLNKIQGRFCCSKRWIESLESQIDVSLIKDFTFASKNHLELRVDVFNSLNLLNYKWGGHEYVNNTRLYQITGFNQDTQAYTYKVDTNAGKLRRVVDGGEFYRIQMGLKYTF